MAFTYQDLYWPVCTITTTTEEMIHQFRLSLIKDLQLNLDESDPHEEFNRYRIGPIPGRTDGMLIVRSEWFVAHAWYVMYPLGEGISCTPARLDIERLWDGFVIRALADTHRVLSKDVREAARKLAEEKHKAEQIAAAAAEEARKARLIKTEAGAKLYSYLSFLDWTYMYSDDLEVYLRGADKMERAKGLFCQTPYEEAKAIWLEFAPKGFDALPK